MGITGGNFIIAETGTLCLVTNEGNGRMVTSLPPGACRAGRDRKSDRDAGRLRHAGAGAGAQRDRAADGRLFADC